MTTSSPALIDHFSDLKDPRIDRNKRHKLIDIVSISICAVICGANTWEQIEEYGKTKYDWLKQFLELPNGIPSHDTIRRLFICLDSNAFQRSFLNWIQSLSGIVTDQVVAIDGKTLRRSRDKGSGKKAIHMVSAWASEMRLVLGQVKTDEKSNEITAIPELIDVLELRGCIVTIDAMGCQKSIAEKIIDKNGDYVLALKENHGNLHEDVKFFFEDALKTDFKDINYSFHETIDGDHGRIEHRKYWIVSDIDWLQGKENWKGLLSIGMTQSQREIDGETSSEIRYYISSLSCDAKLFGNAVRSHWGIENSVHWILDVAFREDESRIRKGNAPENFAVLRHIALNLLKNENSLRKSIKSKRLKAGWDDSYLTKVLGFNNF